MKKMFLALLSLVVVSMFLVSCGPKVGTLENRDALAGQAYGKGDGLIPTPIKPVSPNCKIVGAWNTANEQYLGKSVQEVCSLFSMKCVGKEEATSRYYMSGKNIDNVGKTQLQTFETEWTEYCGGYFNRDSQRSAGYIMNSFDQFDEPQAGPYSWNKILINILCCK